MKHLEFYIAVTLLLFGLTPTVFAAEGESIVLDPRTGDYHVTYLGGDSGDVLQRITFVPATKVEPRVSSSFSLGHQGQIRYQYRLKSLSSSRQPIAMYCLTSVREIASAIPLGKRSVKRISVGEMRRQSIAGQNALFTPRDWQGSVTPTRNHGLRICWSFRDVNSGLLPGKSVNGFGFYSPALPDIFMAEVIGDAPLRGYPDEGPVSPEIAAQVAKLELNDYVSVPVAIPTIVAPTNGDIGSLLVAIQSQLRHWAQLGLIPMDGSASVASLLQSAIDAWNRGNTQQVKVTLRLARNRIKSIFADVDTEKNPGAEDYEMDTMSDKQQLAIKLVARVLAFNLKYAQEQLLDKR